MTAGKATPSWKGPMQDQTETNSDGNPFEGQPQSLCSPPSDNFAPGSSKTSPITLLSRNSTADIQPVIVKSSAAQEPVGTLTLGKSVSTSPTRRVYFSTDVGHGVISPGGHYIKVVITSASGKRLNDILSQLTNDLEWGVKTLGSSVAPSNDTKHTAIIYCFNDMRSAERAIDNAQMIDQKINGTYVTQTEFATAAKSYGTPGCQTAFYDGQVIFAAHFGGEESEFDKSGLLTAVKELAAKYGEVMAMDEKAMIIDGVFEYRTEYFKITDARKALEQLTKANAVQIEERWTVFAKAIPDSTQTSPTRRQVTFAQSTPRKIIENGVPKYESPTGRTAWTIDENGNEVMIPAPRAVPKARGTSLEVTATPSHRLAVKQPTIATRDCAYPPNGTLGNRGRSRELQLLPVAGTTDKEPPVVDIERIRAGQDVRTTIMLRNVPSDMDNEEFLHFLNGTSKGRYDFSYLRFDFSKGTNVGYAFVNFEDPETIAEFVDQREHLPWRPGRDMKKAKYVRVVATAYATTQGIDCCIEKFRNSSVMDEMPKFRPKLWYTKSNTDDLSLIGTERPFPGPNNEAKHQRSCDNAANVGLYLPNGTVRGRDRDRHQKSQYDRGTHAQIQEEAFLNQVMPAPNARRIMHQPSFSSFAAPMMMAPPPGYGGPAAVGLYHSDAYNGFPYHFPMQYDPTTFGYPILGNIYDQPLPVSRQLTYRNGSIGGDLHAGGAVQSPPTPGRGHQYNDSSNGNGNGNGNGYGHGGQNGNGYGNGHGQQYYRNQ